MGGCKPLPANRDGMLIGIQAQIVAALFILAIGNGLWFLASRAERDDDEDGGT